MEPNPYGGGQSPQYPDPAQGGAVYPPYQGQGDPAQGYAQQGYQPYPGQGEPYPGYGQQYAQQSYPQYPQAPGYGQPGYGQAPAYAPYPPGQQYGYAPPMPQQTSGWAIASLVCSLVGLCLTGGIGAILGVIFGHIALSQIRNSNGALGGRGLALAGLIIGYASIALAIIVVIFFVIVASQVPSNPNPTY